MKRILPVVAFVFLNLFVLQSQAQNAPAVNPSVREALSLAPIPGLKAELDGLIKALQQPPGFNGYTAKKTITVAGTPITLLLYLFGDLDQQAVLVVLNGTIAMPGVFNNAAWKKLANTKFKDPIFSYSTIDFDLETGKMNADFQAIIKNSYFNAGSLAFKSGFQVTTNASIGGVMKTVIETGMGVPVQEFTLRAGRVGKPPSQPGPAELLPAATDAKGRAELGRAMAADMKKRSEEAEKEAKRQAGENVEDNKPEFFVEFQLAPGKTIDGPFGMSAVKLTDATIFINNQGTLGYKGNATLTGPGSPPDQRVLPAVMFLETPLSPGGAWDLAESKIGLATPRIALSDFALLGTMLRTPKAAKGNGSFIGNIDNFAGKLTTMAAPLSVFTLTNPLPVPKYKFGDPKSPFPEVRAFNIVALGPLASQGEIKGPLARVFGDANALGQKFAGMRVDLSPSGLKGDASGNFSIDLRKVALGSPGINMKASVNIDQNTQAVGLSGSLADRSLNFAIEPTAISLNSPASCSAPVGITARANLTPKISFTDVSNSITGVNVDPAKITGCVGEALKAAYKWIGDNGAKLGGYTVAAAKEAGKALEQGGKAVGAAVVQGGQAVGQGAQVAAKTTSDFVSGKWKHHPNRPVYDCINQDPNTNPRLAEAYPPGRLWGSHEDFKSRGMNFARYVFGTDKKFHPILGGDAKRTLGGTACGGLVGEDGVGYGRTNTADDEIWTKAVFCTAIPAAMVGAPVNGAGECYKARGLQKPARPDLWGKFVHITGSGIDLWFIFTRDGAVRQVAKNVPCGSGDLLNLTLHDIYQLPYGGVFANTAECVASTPAAVNAANQRAAAAQQEAQRQQQAQQARQAYLNSLRGRFLAYCDVYKNTHLIGNDGRRHWIANKDKWWVFNGCANGAPVACVSLAEIQGIPEGDAIGTVARCNALK